MLDVTGLSLNDAASGSGKYYGCFCTRFVTAEDTATAVSSAKLLVLDELHRKGIACLIEQLATESVEQISDSMYARRTPGTGFTFYPIETR